MSCGFQLKRNKKRLPRFIEVTRCLEKEHLKHNDLNKKLVLFFSTDAKKIKRDYKCIFLFELSIRKCKSSSHCLGGRHCSVAVNNRMV